MQKATFQAGRCSGTKHNFGEYNRQDYVQHPEKTGSNLCYDLRSGEMLPLPAGEACEEGIIRGAYTVLYSEGLEARNARYRASRHEERCKGIEELYKAPKTRPKETILQIGNVDEHATEEQLIRAVELYVERVQKYCEEHGIKHQFLSCAIHLDESTPHAHIKEVYSAVDSHGHLMPMQEECFRQAGVQLPDPAAPEGRYNNRTITFDSMRRDMFEGICMELGIELDRERRSGRKHMERQAYIVEQQAATIERQAGAIEHQTQQIRNNNGVLQNQVEQYRENQRLLAAQYEKKSTIEQWIREQLPQIREQIHATRQQMEELGILDMSMKYLDYVKEHDYEAYEGIMRRGVDGIDLALREVVDAMEDIGIEDI